MSKNIVTILCSGIGLGLYIPGLLMENQFRKMNICTEIQVFESLLPDDIKEKIIQSKKSYHSNFMIALMSTRIPIDMGQNLDSHLVNELLDKWQKDKRTNFIVLSGHWLHVLDAYKARMLPTKLNVDILYIDCDLPPSWKSIKTFKPDYNENYNEVWLYNHKKTEIQYKITITDKPPIPFRKRSDRFLIHGGGWGIGTYKDKIPELEAHGIKLDVVCYNPEEAENKKDGNRYFMIDPAWSAWKKNHEDRYEFPPFSEIKPDRESNYKNKEKYHDLFDISRKVKAIIGKPGACTLMDSLEAATPLIMLEPFGDHERKNTEFWERLGFGILYGRWKENNFSEDILEKLHRNIAEKNSSYADYTVYFASRI